MTNCIGLDLVQSDSEASDDAVARFIEEHGTGLYALALHVANIETVHDDLTTDGIEPVGEIVKGEVTEYLYHPRDFDKLFVFLAEFLHAFETNHPTFRTPSAHFHPFPSGGFGE